MKKIDYSLFEDERFKWIIASTDVDVNDGILIDIEQGARMKFESEANPQDLDIKDYIKHLKKEIKELNAYLEQAEVENRVLHREMNEQQDEFLRMECLYHDEVTKPWYKKLFTRQPK